jgi:hypothetical protein
MHKTHLLTKVLVISLLRRKSTNCIDIKKNYNGNAQKPPDASVNTHAHQNRYSTVDESIMKI